MTAPPQPYEPDPKWPPSCRRCGWSGVASAEASPYIACGGDPAKHHRAPVAERFVQPARTGSAAAPARPAAVQAPRPARPRAPRPKAVPPRRQAAWTPPPVAVVGSPRERQARATVGRGDCNVCHLPFALRPGMDGPVVNSHGPTGARCPGGENPPAPGTEHLLAGAS